MYNKDTICVLPFMHLSVFQDGKLKPCCISDTFFDENYNDFQNFDELFNNPSYQKLREDLKNGVKNKMCDVCWKKEEYGGRSFRQEKNVHFKKQYDELMNGKETNDLVFLDIRFSNQCNFKCRMCGERDSTSWYDERRDYCEKNNIPFDSKKLHILNNDFSREDLEKLEYVYIAGGEPLYTKKAWDFIETIPYPQNVDLQFQTNLSMLDYKGKNIFDLTKNFKKVVYSISLDGLFEVGEFTRTNFKTSTFLSNLNRLNEVKKEYNNIVYDFTYTSSILNVFSFFETFDYLIDNRYITDYANIRFQFVRYPDILDTKNFNVIDEVKRYYERRHTLKGIEHSPFLIGDIENLLIYLDKENNENISEYLEKLKNYLIFARNYNNIEIPSTLKKYISLI